MNSERHTAPDTKPPDSSASGTDHATTRAKVEPVGAAAGDRTAVVAEDRQGVATGAEVRRPTAGKRGDSGWRWLLKGLVQGGVFVGFVCLALLLVGLAQRYQWITPEGAGIASGGTDGAGAAGSGTERYICPMMCVPPTSQPGRCPVCGMELVPATAAEGGDGLSISLSPVARRLAGIETATSQLGELTRTIRTIGSITYNESRLSTISAYVDGRLEQLFANFVGVKVQQGEDLAVIYSPQLYSAQTELVTSLTSRSAAGRLGLDDLTAISRQNLIELGMTEEQIVALEKTRTPSSRIRLKSPQSGTVIAKSAVEGEYVKTGQVIYRVADLSTVWLMLDLFPDDAALIRFGQEVEAEIQSRPGEVCTGRVAFVDPVVNPQTRTVRVRVEFLNFDGSLRPGDYATARLFIPSIAAPKIFDPALAGRYISPMHPQVIRDEPGECPLCGMELVSTETYGYAPQPIEQRQLVTIPRSAVLLAGDAAIVYVETDPGRFEIRRVTVGPMTAESVAVIEGLAAGEQVATAGNFLIDSQMQLAGNPSLLDPLAAPRFPPGPLSLPQVEPQPWSAAAAQQLEQVFQLYFDIHAALAADTTPAPLVVTGLVDALRKLEVTADVSDATQRYLARGRQAAGGLNDGLEQARQAFRTLSHNLLPVAAEVSRNKPVPLYHFYCPMVRGGGGDWFQADPKLQNPYWGSEMLTCGELVQELPLVKSQ